MSKDNKGLLYDFNNDSKEGLVGSPSLVKWASSFGPTSRGPKK